MKKNLTTWAVCLAATLCTSLRSDAAPFTVTFGAQNTGSPLGLSSGTDLPTGSLIRFGYFTISEAEVLAKFDQLTLLDGCFVELASTHVGEFGGSTVLNTDFTIQSHTGGSMFPAPGAFAHNVTFDAAAMNLVGTTRFWIWAFNSGTLPTATEHGMFSDETWATSSFGTATYDVGDPSPSDPNDIYYATEGPEQSSIGMGTLNKLQAIPEPTAGALALAGLGLLFRRRRCSSR